MKNKSTWIWYPGDYEIWLGNRMNSRRTERGAFFPPFWKMDSHYVTVEFSKTLDLEQEEESPLSMQDLAGRMDELERRMDEGQVHSEQMAALAAAKIIREEIAAMKAAGVPSGN